MRKKRISAIILVVCLSLIMLVAVGCSNSGSNEPTTATDSKTINFTDSAGRQVEVPAQITKIVPSGSMAQIALFALAPDMLVGVSNEWNPAAEQYLDSKYYDLPVLGQFFGTGDLSLEEIAKVDPQVIIDVGESKSSIVEDMDGITEQVGIPTVHIEATTETMGDAYRMLGELLDREKEAEVLAEYCEDIYSKTHNIMKKVGDDGKVDLVYCAGGDGLNVIAKDSFHAEILDLVSNNKAVIEDVSSKGTGNPVDMEQIVLWDPDVIVFAPDSIYSSVGEDKAWQKLTAIKNGNYYEVPMGPYNWMGFPPSVNRYMGMIWIAQLLYPDKAQYDVYEEAAKYYELFYHSKLTKDQYKALVANSLLKAEQ